MKLLLGLGDTVQSLSALVGIAIGFLMMIPEVTLWIRHGKINNYRPLGKDCHGRNKITNTTLHTVVLVVRTKTQDSILERECVTRFSTSRFFQDSNPSGPHDKQANTSTRYSITAEITKFSKQINFFLSSNLFFYYKCVHP